MQRETTGHRTVKMGFMVYDVNSSMRQPAQNVACPVSEAYY